MKIFPKIILKKGNFGFVLFQRAVVTGRCLEREGIAGKDEWLPRHQWRGRLSSGIDRGPLWGDPRASMSDSRDGASEGAFPRSFSQAFWSEKHLRTERCPLQKRGRFV